MILQRCIYIWGAKTTGGVPPATKFYKVAPYTRAIQ
jgi:hypothetical protein